MPSQKDSNSRLAYLLLRATIGVNILMHGVSRILAGPGHFESGIIQQFHATVLPHPLLVAFGYSLPWVEATLGFLVLIGLFTRVALVLSALVIIVLTFGSGLIQDWRGVGEQLLYAAVYAALLVFLGANRFSLDTLLRRERKSPAK